MSHAARDLLVDAQARRLHRPRRVRLRRLPPPAPPWLDVLRPSPTCRPASRVAGHRHGSRHATRHRGCLGVVDGGGARAGDTILKCTIEGCDKDIRCKGVCESHYKRQRLQAKAANPCGCGCGELTAFGFKHGHHTRLFTSEEQSRRGRQNNGNALRDRGTKDTYRKVNSRHEHRSIAEKKIGRALLPDEIVHHKDHNKRNNHPDNLEVMTRKEHSRLHALDYQASKRAKNI